MLIGGMVPCFCFCLIMIYLDFIFCFKICLCFLLEYTRLHHDLLWIYFEWNDMDSCGCSTPMFWAFACDSCRVSRWASLCISHISIVLVIILKILPHRPSSWMFKKCHGFLFLLFCSSMCNCLFSCSNIREKTGFFSSSLGRRKRSTCWVMELKYQNSRNGHGCCRNEWWSL